MNLGGESGLQKVGLCGIHPLTRRYVLMSNICNDQCIKILER
ncbi:hypothetical protein CRN46_16650 [Vibrio vulnificus]|nr:hypothetical protein CRN46_16650 [Vibrio vulnificus]